MVARRWIGFLMTAVVAVTLLVLLAQGAGASSNQCDPNEKLRMLLMAERQPIPPPPLPGSAELEWQADSGTAAVDEAGITKGD